MRRMSSDPGISPRCDRTGVRPAIAAALACALVVGCSPERGPEESSASDSASARSGPAVTPARYRTDLTAVPFTEPEGAVHLRFRQDVTGRTVRRTYAGWRLDAPEGSRILTIRDSLAAPRAAWRILPGPGLRVVAGEGEEPISLLLDGDGPAWELSVDSTLAAWPGPTGQRERLSLGRISTDSVRSALVVVRREARPLDAPGVRALSHLFVLVGADGRGVAVQARRSEPPPGAPAEDRIGGPGLEASVRIHGPRGTRSLEGARLVPDDTAASPAAWELRSAGGDPLGRMEVEAARIEMHEGRGDPTTPLRFGAEESRRQPATVSLEPARGSVDALGDGSLSGLHVVVRGGG